MHHIFTIRLSVDGYLGCFQLLAIMNRATLNMGEQLFLYQDAKSFRYIAPLGMLFGIAGLVVYQFSGF